MPPVRDRPIVHFTHVENLRSIVESGSLLADSLIKASGTPIHDCANAEIKERRRRKAVPVLPHSTVGDYVPFYYAPRSPMMYAIHTGGVPEYRQGQEPLVYLWSYLSTVAEHGLTWVASDGNGAHSLSEFTDDWNRLESFTDWPIMQERIWHDTHDDGDRRRRRMAEFLVYKRFPLTAVRGIVALSQETAKRARSNLSGSLQVHVLPHWYY